MKAFLLIVSLLFVGLSSIGQNQNVSNVGNKQEKMTE